MIPFKNLPQYSRVVRAIRFPQDANNPFLLIYFSENSSFLEDYPRLNLKRIDFRYVVVPTTRIPRTRLTGEFKKAYMSMKLLPYTTKQKYPSRKNMIYDVSNYVNAIDIVYKPNTYRQRAGFLLNNALLNAFASFPANYQKVLIYSVDTRKPINTFMNRKIFPLVRALKQGEIYFDHLILCTIDSSPKYRLIVKDGEFNFARTLQYLRRVKVTVTEEDEEEEVTVAANKVMKKIDKDVEPEHKASVKDAVKTFLRVNKKATDKIAADEVDDLEIKKTATASVLYKTNPDFEKIKGMVAKVTAKNASTAVKAVSKQYADELLPKQKSVNTSDYVVVDSLNVPKMIDNKTPEHIFDKRRIDFETNLKKDMSNAFKVLEKRDLPLKFISIKVVDAPKKAGELRQSDTAYVIMILRDKFGKDHEVRLEIPKIDPETGTFRVNGERKCLINQIILNPISFPKPYDSKFESSYSSFHIYSKKTKRLSYLEIYMGSFKLPYLILLAYAFGFERSLKMYGIKYSIVDKKPKGKVSAQIPSSYIVFDGLDTTLKKEVAESFIQGKVHQYNIDSEFGTKEYFNDLIIAMTGRVGSTFLIASNIENIVDPVARQVLVNKQLPNDLPNIMKYMAQRAVDGYEQDRNDLTNQRIRNSEILVHLAQKQLLAAYTEYKEQFLAGNKDAKLTLDEGKIMSQFVNLEIVQNMEYANPLEEMATVTKVSPVGKSVGGIPDKQAINLDARNVHPSYYGNIDPLDTAEGGNIGITQQLTVDAYITTARGLFNQKAMNNKEAAGILSTSTAMVPFIENNEGARIIMSANQSKQMLPLKNPEPPIVQSGYESALTNVLSDAFIKRSPCNGKITSITGDYIEVNCGKRKQRVDITPTHLKSGSGVNSLSVFIPKVKVGQTVKNRQIIAEGGSIANGTISLGRNLAACYMPYKGYNFEDGLVISEKLVKEDKLTSLHGIVEEVEVDASDKILKIAEIGQRTKKGDPLLIKAMGDIEELLSGLEEEEEDETTDIYDGNLIKKSPGGTVVDIDVFSNLKETKFPELKSLIDRTAKRYKKPANEKFKIRGVPIKGILIRFKIEQELKIGLGDKLCNRYGNKGIISLIEKEEFMPRTPWGARAEIIMNPLGVIGRMNMGQMYELYCGLMSRTIADRLVKTKDKKQIAALIKSVYSHLDSSPNKEFANNLASKIGTMPDKKFKQMINQIETTRQIPIVIPPFKAPSRQNIAQALKTLGLKTGYKLSLPEYNTKTKNEVPFGYLYIAKLEHIGANKIHSRSTGPTVGKTSQPTAGKRREGGQRMGEGDTWALLSYNCPTVLSEMFGPLSDDVVSKKEMEAEIVETGNTDFKATKASPTKDLLNAYFVSLMLGD